MHIVFALFRYVFYKTKQQKRHICTHTANGNKNVRHSWFPVQEKSTMKVIIFSCAWCLYAGDPFHSLTVWGSQTATKISTTTTIAYKLTNYVRLRKVIEWKATSSANEKKSTGEVNWNLCVWKCINHVFTACLAARPPDCFSHFIICAMQRMHTHSQCTHFNMPWGPKWKNAEGKKPHIFYKYVLYMVCWNGPTAGPKRVGRDRE